VERVGDRATSFVVGALAQRVENPALVTGRNCWRLAHRRGRPALGSCSSTTRRVVGASAIFFCGRAARRGLGRRRALCWSVATVELVRDDRRRGRGARRRSRVGGRLAFLPRRASCARQRSAASAVSRAPWPAPAIACGAIVPATFAFAPCQREHAPATNALPPRPRHARVASMRGLPTKASTGLTLTVRGRRRIVDTLHPAKQSRENSTRSAARDEASASVVRHSNGFGVAREPRGAAGAAPTSAAIRGQPATGAGRRRSPSMIKLGQHAAERRAIAVPSTAAPPTTAPRALGRRQVANHRDEAGGAAERLRAGRDTAREWAPASAHATDATAMTRGRRLRSRGRQPGSAARSSGSRERRARGLTRRDRRDPLDRRIDFRSWICGMPSGDAPSASETPAAIVEYGGADARHPHSVLGRARRVSPHAYQLLGQTVAAWTAPDPQADPRRDPRRSATLRAASPSASMRRPRAVEGSATADIVARGRGRPARR